MIGPNRRTTIEVRMSHWSFVLALGVVPAVAGAPMGRLFLWAGGLVAVIILAGFAVGRIRKWMRPDGQKSSSEAWSLQDLRVLRQQGRISDQEFETLKAAIIAEYQSKPKPAEKGGKTTD